MPVMAPVDGVQRQAAGQGAGGHREGVWRESAADGRGGAVQRYADSPELTAGQVSVGAPTMVKGQVADGRNAVGVLHLDGESAGSGGRAGNGAGDGVQRQAAGQRAGHREGVRRGSAADGRGGAVQRRADFARVDGRAGERRRRRRW